MAKTVTEHPEIKKFIEKSAGDGAVKLIDIYEKKKRPLTDEEIAAHLGLRVTEVRTILNRLHYRGIAQYQKTRNNKTGWYSYTWEINKKRVLELIIEEQLEEIGKLEKQQQKEEGYSLFSCKSDCDNHPFEIAAQYHFKCPECGNMMEGLDSEKRIKTIKKRIVDMKKQMADFKTMI